LPAIAPFTASRKTKTATEILTVCGESESTARRLRILKERRTPSEVDLLLEETQSLQEEID
jgi:hypothetical protein